MAVGLTGILFAQDDKNDVPSPPTPVADLAVPNAVPEVLGAEPGEVLTRGRSTKLCQAGGRRHQRTANRSQGPPALIEELPPDERPVGENVLWIPGYFAWDEDRLDFIWISGVYRDAPRGILGSRVTGDQPLAGPNGFRVFGLQSHKKQQIKLKPKSSFTQSRRSRWSKARPSAAERESFWIPGNWRYVSNKYAWQAGYWSAAQHGLDLVPAPLHWNAAGYVLYPRVWDYSLAQRGLVFAPVYFDAAYYANPVVYRPQVILRSNFLTVHLWSRTPLRALLLWRLLRQQLRDRGLPSLVYTARANRNYYDPLFTYYSWQGRRVDRAGIIRSSSAMNMW